MAGFRRVGAISIIGYLYPSVSLFTVVWKDMDCLCKMWDTRVPKAAGVLMFGARRGELRWLDTAVTLTKEDFRCWMCLEKWQYNSRVARIPIQLIPLDTLMDLGTNTVSVPGLAFHEVGTTWRTSKYSSPGIVDRSCDIVSKLIAPARVRAWSQVFTPGLANLGRGGRRLFFLPPRL